MLIRFGIGMLQSDFGLNGYTRYKVYVWKMLGTFYFRTLNCISFYYNLKILYLLGIWDMQGTGSES